MEGVIMTKKAYSPVASYTELKRVEGEIEQAQSIETLRKIVSKDGPKVGYKAFCYMLGRKMSHEAMKPDEACVAAATLEQQGQAEAAQMIYKKVVEAHPDHSVAKSKV
jgi:hypothetical protein